MQRPASTGITISAAIVLAGSSLTTMGGLAVILIASLVPRFAPEAHLTPPVAVFIFFDAFFFLGLGIWGIFSAIGLFELKNWARISTMVFAAMLAFISLPTALLMAVVPLSDPNAPDLPANFLLIFRVMIVSFETALVGLAFFWLVFFNRRTVKSQFTPQLAAPFSTQTYIPSAPGLPPQGVVPFSAATRSQRPHPLAITVIGWIVLAGSAFMVLSLAMNHLVFPRLQYPAPALGFFLSGRYALVYLLVITIAQAAAAAAMLKRKPWGLRTTAGLQLLHVVNALLVVAIPSQRLRYEQAMTTNLSSINSTLPHAQTHPLHLFPAWFGLAIGLCTSATVLFFLLYSRQAFLSAVNEASRTDPQSAPLI